MSDEANADAVLTALERLTAWSEMARSPQLTRFLDYIVRKRIVGDTQSIKAYSIAVDVFGRPPDFDPQSDPIVRVQARRLRALLDQYYRGPGAEETLRILLPIGRYVPDFVEVEPTAPAASRVPLNFAEQEAELGVEAGRSVPRGHVTVSWFVLLVIAIGAAALAYSLSTWSPRRDNQVQAQGALPAPSIQVLEFQNLTGDSTLTAPISALAIEIVTDFGPYLIIDASYAGRDAPRPESPNSYVLTGLVQRGSTEESDYQISAILTDVLTNSVIWTWSDAIDRNDLTRVGGIDAISQDLLMLLGGTRGPLHDRARKVLAETSIVGQENSYLCAVLFSEYRTTANAETAKRVSSCFDAMPVADQQSGTVLAARASLVAEAVGVPVGSISNQLERFGAANVFLDEALRVAPTNAFVWEQRARIQEELGMHDLAEAAYGMSLQLNKSGIDANAAHARHLALTGQLETAVPIAKSVIDVLRPELVPDWFYCVPALDALRRDDFARALSFAERCAHADAELGPILALLAAQGIDDRAMVAQQLSRVLEVQSFRNGGIVTRMRRRIADEELLGRIRTGLTEAGVPALSLVSAY